MTCSGQPTELRVKPTIRMPIASSVRTFSGNCHCGALGLSFQTALPPAEWSVRACQCSFCRLHGALSTSDPAGRLTFHVKDVDSLQRYRFALKTADFLVCGRCGVYVGAQIETPRGAFGIINALTLAPMPHELPPAARADYSAESSADRVRRREQRWTPLTGVAPASARSAGARGGPADETGAGG